MNEVPQASALQTELNEDDTSLDLSNVEFSSVPASVQKTIVFSCTLMVLLKDFLLLIKHN